MKTENLEQLKIDRFLGKNIKASPYDIEHHQAQIIRHFEISKIIGSLVKSFGYELATDIIGSNYTDFQKLAGMDTGANLGNIFIWKNNDNIYVVAWDSVNDKIYYWINAYMGWTQLDVSETYNYDKVRFFTRNNALILSSGIGATNYPVHIDYFDARTIFGSEVQAAAFEDSRLNSLAWNNDFSFTITAYQNLGNLEPGAYFYYGCLVYDDVQNGDISGLLAVKTTTTEDSNIVKVAIANTDASDVSRRATHIKVFRAYNSYEPGDPFPDLEMPATKTWQASFLVATIPLNNDYDALHTNLSGEGTFTLGTLKVSGLSNFSVSNNIFVGFYLALWQAGGTKIYKRITANDSSDFTILDGTGLTDGYTYFWEVVSYWWDNGANYECYVADKIFALPTNVRADINREYQNVRQYNFRYMLTHDKRTLYAPIYDVEAGKVLKNVIGVSNINPEGAEHDIIKHFINLRDYGVNEVIGLGRILDYAIIFTDTDIFKITMTSGEIFDWSLEETFDDVKVIAPDSLCQITGNEFKYTGWFYRSDDGYRVFDGYKSILLSLPIEEEDKFPFDVTDPTEAVSTYNPVTKQWIIVYPSDGIVHKFDLLSNEWLDTTNSDWLIEFCLSNNGRLLATDGLKIVVMTNDGTNNITTQDGSNINPYWFSKAYNCNAAGVTKIAKYIAITYKSDTPIRVRWFIDKSTNPKGLLHEDAFGVQTTVRTKLVGLPTSQRFDEIELLIDLADAYKAINTILQIDSIILFFRFDTLDKL